ncbi:MAG TPA: tetratricopeptide repeat protein, partial [Lamprocystis sp. (in: g-proteobacteria)]|nr:tetratricopeptide repeat protein [Lamprocystis sp. (in: g-proteobacteria)]
DLAPAQARYAYVYAVALDSAQQTAAAIPVLEGIAARDAGRSEVLVALVQYNAKLGKRDAAQGWLDKLAVAAPGDAAVAELRTSLGH